jgi:hypothetical protein
MPFASALPKLLLAADKLANLPRRPPGKKSLPRWDPTACNPFEQEAIGRAFSTLALTAIREVEIRGGDWTTLANAMKTKTASSLTITCDWDARPISSNASLKTINFGSVDTSNRLLLEMWLTVEVVKLCGGTDLDAWAVKNWLYNVDKSPRYYYPLLSSEKDLMCAGGTRLPSPLNYLLAGRFTIWDPAAGKLWPSTKDTSGRRVPYGQSLIDMGIPYWRHPCP